MQLWRQGSPARLPAGKPLHTCPGTSGGTWQVYLLPDDAAPQDELLCFLLDADGRPTAYAGRALVTRDKIESTLPDLALLLESLQVKPL